MKRVSAFFAITLAAALSVVGVAYAASVTQPASTATALRGTFCVDANNSAVLSIRMTSPNGDELRTRRFSVDSACTQWENEHGQKVANAPAKFCTDLAALMTDLDNEIAAASAKLVPVQ